MIRNSEFREVCLPVRGNNGIVGELEKQEHENKGSKSLFKNDFFSPFDDFSRIFKTCVNEVCLEDVM